MKKTLLLLFTVLLLAGCVSTEVVTLNLSKPSLDEIKSAYVGDIFFEREEGEQTRQRGGMIGDVNVGGFRYDLTVVELNEEKIGLMYAEYAYPNTMSVGGWVIKQGFNKRFDYALSDKVIRFKGLEFEIISVEKGLLRYRRVK